MYASGELIDRAEAKPGAVAALMQAMHEYCTLDQTLILLRGVACQVSRSDPFFHVPSSIACWLLSGS